MREDSPPFSEFDIKPEIVQALADVGIVRTFAIQELTLPIALAGNDLIGQARTGTGKTLGFGVPLLNRLELPGGAGAAPQALVDRPDPRAGRAGARPTSPRPASGSAPASSPSTAAAPTSRRSRR